jgi:ribonuclease BN (tRNA processing enzyme)
MLDTQYTDAEYAEHIGWGHSSLSSVVSLALDADVHRLLLFHHDPSHDDQMLDKMAECARALVRKSGKSLEVEPAREGAEISITLPASSSTRITASSELNSSDLERLLGS